MSLPSPLRLLCLCLATFFLVHLALGLLVSAMSPMVLRWAVRWKAGTAARCLLALRLLPPAGALFAVAGLCVPSYLWLEQETGTEEVGLMCLLAAVLGGFLWSRSIARGLQSANRSSHFAEECQRAGSAQNLPGEDTPVWIVDRKIGSLMLAGILRPQVFISRQAVGALSSEQLSIAVEHELAHLAARDNLKRLLIMLSPGLLPRVHGFSSIERAWMRFSEWAADDRAVAGDPHRGLFLASALVSVARLRQTARPPALVTSLFDEGAELEARVDRLLNPPATQTAGKHLPVFSIGTLATTAALLAVVLRPGTFYSVHNLLERFIH